MDPIYFKLGVIVLIGISILLYWLFNFTILYHLIRFGIGVQPKKIALVFSLGSIGLFFITIILFSTIDTSGLVETFRTLGESITNIKPI